jgi:site-specific DNA recombinase
MPDVHTRSPQLVLPVRCAIYTRKSTEIGLDQEVNSLVAQRESCSAYIKSHRHEQWVELPEHYDDGGYSGGTLARPALRRLLSDVEAGRIDIVLFYKIDRLTRSLTDFVRLIDVMERFGVAFVSITQAFDTSSSMGRWSSMCF